MGYPNFKYPNSHIIIFYLLKNSLDATDLNPLVNMTIKISCASNLTNKFHHKI